MSKVATMQLLDKEIFSDCGKIKAFVKFVEIMSFNYMNDHLRMMTAELFQMRFQKGLHQLDFLKCLQ